MHSVLKRQLRKLGLSQDIIPDNETWNKFLERVNSFYKSTDQDRYLMQRSSKISNDEMRTLNNELEQALDHLRQLSMTDELTGLMNRRFLNVSIPEEVAQVVRNYRNLDQGCEDRTKANMDMLFAMIDIDHFKVVNDTYGHAAGDKVLMQMKERFKKFTRASDTLIRWGGEEFMVVSRNVSRTNYETLLNRLHNGIKSALYDIDQDNKLKITCSIGAAVFPFHKKWPSSVSWENVVQVVDTCLYAAKRSGRDAWVGVMSTDKATVEDINTDLSQHLPELIQSGKIEMKTSITSDDVKWNDDVLI